MLSKGIEIEMHGRVSVTWPTNFRLYETERYSGALSRLKGSGAGSAPLGLRGVRRSGLPDAIQQKASHLVAVRCLNAVQIGVHMVECPQLMLPESTFITIRLMAFWFQLNQALERCTPALSVTEQIVGDQQDTVLYLGRQVERMPPSGSTWRP